MAIPVWVEKYIGLPFKVKGRDRSGIDCWGLVLLVTFEQQAVVMPAFDKGYDGTYAPDDAAKIGNIVKTVGPISTVIPAGQEKCFDVIVLRLKGQPMHVGIVLGDGIMLHIESGIESCIESYHSMRWKDRIYGIYRYAPSGN